MAADTLCLHLSSQLQKDWIFHAAQNRSLVGDEDETQSLCLYDKLRNSQMLFAFQQIIQGAGLPETPK